MRFASPSVLWLAALASVYVLALFLYDRVQRRMLSTRLGELPVLGKVTASASPRRRSVKLILQAFGLGLVVFSVGGGSTALGSGFSINSSGQISNALGQPTGQSLFGGGPKGNAFEDVGPPAAPLAPIDRRGARPFAAQQNRLA